MSSPEYFTEKPTLEDYHGIVPDVAEEEAEDQLEYLPSRYFLLFSRSLLSRFARILASLSAERPFYYETEKLEEGGFEVRIIALEKSFFFSLVSGALSAGGLDIHSGDIFTYYYNVEYGSGAEPKNNENPGAAYGGQGKSRRRAGRTGSGLSRAGKELRGRYFSTASKSSPETSRKVVDVFRGRLTEPGDEKEIKRILEQTLSLLFSKDSGEDVAVAKKSTLERAKEKVAEELSRRLVQSREKRAIPPFYPIEFEAGEEREGSTQLFVRSQDTPFFLYTFGTVLALHEISIEHVEIKTAEHEIEDTFYVRSSRGGPIKEEEQLNSLKLSILFTKQFTHYLWNAPDPYRALLRFETLIRDLRSSSENDSIRNLIADANVLTRLSRLLGASDFLWEDFIRLQYENILPILSGDTVVGDLDLSFEGLEEELDRRLESVEGFDEKKKVLNRFKDRFTYLVDLEHILEPDADFSFLSTHLSNLAEIVLRRAFDIAWEYLVEIYGTPRTVADLPTAYTVVALGKFGGKALGYASDIELMFLYRDAGETDGEKKISNAEFFTHFIKTAASIIESKREGIYKIDLRLRPHGSGGPPAVSLSRFVSYYRSEASSLEKLALVRLRSIAGDEEFGKQVERVRDTVLYEGTHIDVEELIRLRKVQAQQYVSTDRPNVKYGPGGLVDLEYSVQILQVLEGRAAEELRSPYMHEVFRTLTERGAIDAETTSMLEGSYFFLRRLINALRMLRGHALDLYLPPRGSSEFVHLARRMGYRETDGVSPDEQLFVDFRKNSAVVRSFVEHRLGTHAVPGGHKGNIADLLLTEYPNEKDIDHLFAGEGFADARRGFYAFTTLMHCWEDSTRFLELALFAWDYVRTSPDPDMALNNWERFVSSLSRPELHFEEVSRQPKRLEILLRICAGSQFLADLLIRNPDFFSEVTDPAKIRVPVTFEEYSDELHNIRKDCNLNEPEDWRLQLRRFKNRHILRIGSRDICYGVPLEEVLEELSGLAEAVIGEALAYRLDKVREEEGQDFAESICVLAFGKLGGGELNYSSDIDLVVLFDEISMDEKRAKKLRQTVRKFRGDIADVTEEGFAYRVDFRLRPYGNSGELVFTPSQMEHYYRSSAGVWELQALLKARPVAGQREMGQSLLERVHDHAFSRLWAEELFESVQWARGLHTQEERREENGELPENVKEGQGGLRDIEFAVQLMQLLHAENNPQLLDPSTLEAIRRLEEEGYLGDDEARLLSEDYRFLRRVEHFLQLLENRQEHSLPQSERAFEALAGRMQWTSICSGDFRTRLHSVMEEVHSAYESILLREKKRL